MSGLIPSITALKKASLVLARAATREAQASASVSALFGGEFHDLVEEIRTNVFDLHQVAEFLNQQAELRKVPSKSRKTPCRKTRRG